ncbi:MAG: BrnA antitoxin family protein [Pseudomonadota bacterium]
MGQVVRRRTREQEKDLKRMIDDVEALEIEQSIFRRMWGVMPDGWRTAHEDAPCGPAKTKMTIRLESDVLEWYRSLGHGYQNRINTVLRAYKNAVTSKWIEMEDDRDVKGNLI